MIEFENRNSSVIRICGGSNWPIQLVIVQLVQRDAVTNSPKPVTLSNDVKPGWSHSEIYVYYLYLTFILLPYYAHVLYTSEMLVCLFLKSDNLLFTKNFINFIGFVET